MDELWKQICAISNIRAKARNLLGPCVCWNVWPERNDSSVVLSRCSHTLAHIAVVVFSEAGCTVVCFVCWCRNALTSSFAPSLSLSLLLPHMFSLFSFLHLQNILQAHMTLFFRARYCWQSHVGCWRGNHKEKHTLFGEVRGPTLRMNTRQLPEHRLLDC